MNQSVVTLLTFLAVFLAVFAINAALLDLIPRDRKRISQRLDEEFRKRQREKAKQSPLFRDLSQLAAESLEDEAIYRPTWQERLKAFLEQSGLRLTPLRLLLLSGGSCLAGAFIGLLLGRGWLLPAAILAVVGALVPVAYVELKRRQRMEKLRSQLPDAFDLMSRVMRAGQTASQGMLAVSEEFTVPIAEEFGYCYEQQNLGLPVELALRDLARRTGLLEMKIFVMAMMVQRQTGGNLAELLDKLATVVRDRYRIQGMIRTLTAEGRLQAVVLLALPPIVFFVLMLLNRRYMLILVEYPYLILATIIAMIVGGLWIRKIINFDF